MYKRTGNSVIDRRDEIVLALMAVLIPLATLPGLIGL
jgi:hypothetical protein